MKTFLALSLVLLFGVLYADTAYIKNSDGSVTKTESITTTIAQSDIQFALDQYKNQLTELDNNYAKSRAYLLKTIVDLEALLPQPK